MERGSGGEGREREREMVHDGLQKETKSKYLAFDRSKPSGGKLFTPFLLQLTAVT